MKYISLNWTLALKFSIGKKKRMRDCRILTAHDCISRLLTRTVGNSLSLSLSLCHSILSLYVSVSLSYPLTLIQNT